MRNLIRSVKRWIAKNPLIFISVSATIALLVYQNWPFISYKLNKFLGMAKKVITNELGFINPIVGVAKVTTQFGKVDSLHSKPHNGIDLAVKKALLFACGDGIAHVVSNDYGGKQVKVQHSNGYATGFAHMDSINVKNGQKVKQGDIIGVSGNSGSHTTGYHLHFTLTDPSGNKIDPLKYFKFSF